MGFTPGHTRAGHDLSTPLVFLSLAPPPLCARGTPGPMWGLHPLALGEDGKGTDHEGHSALGSAS